jgi:hypothetical protein
MRIIMTADVYLPSDQYRHMLDELESVARSHDPAALDELRTRLIMAVGEIGGVWPDSCLVDQETV